MGGRGRGRVGGVCGGWRVVALRVTESGETAGRRRPAAGRLLRGLGRDCRDPGRPSSGERAAGARVWDTVGPPGPYDRPSIVWTCAYPQGKEGPKTVADRVCEEIEQAIPHEAGHIWSLKDVQEVRLACQEIRDKCLINGIAMIF